MKKLLLFCILIFSVSGIIAQSFGNEWINYNQKYYEFKIVKDGIYRVTYADLASAGIPINTINPKNIQVFGRGTEIPLYIQGEGDNTFNPTDFIEFVARKNDGWLDSNLYKGFKNQPNPYYSLITDTASYYLTWNTSGNNLRYQIETDNNFTGYTPVPSILVEKRNSFQSNYYDGETVQGDLTSPEYVPSEGWMSPVISNSGQRTFTTNVNSEKAASNGFAAIEFLVTGQSNYGPIQNGDHHLVVNYSNQSLDTIFEGYQLIRKRKLISTSNLGQLTTAFSFNQIDDLGAGSDRMSIGYVKIQYDHLPDAEGKSFFEFAVNDVSVGNKSYLRLNNFAGSTNNFVIDETNNRRIEVTQVGNEYRFLIPNGGLKSCIIFSENAVQSVGGIRPAGENGFFNDYFSTIPDSAYLMVSNPILANEVFNYFNYRQAKGFRPFVVDVNQLYKQYGFGIAQHPLAIRNFLNELVLKKSAPPKYLYFIGKSVRAKFVRGKPSLFANNLVPTMGNPATDNLFSSGIGTSGLEVAIPTGRIAARNTEELKMYLNKVVEYESATTANWMKNALHFVGGTSLFETQQLENYMIQYANTFTDVQFGGKVSTFKKTTSAPIQTTLSDSIHNLINSGASLMTFFGHASNTGGFDINIDEPQNLKNKGKYPFILGNACYTGDVHQEGNLSTSEGFVLIADKGAIGFIATVDLSYSASLNVFSSEFYRQFSDKNYGKSMAYCMQQAVKTVGPNPDPSLESVLLEMSLHGDPALVMNSPLKPDFRILKSNISFNPREVTTEVDSFFVNIALENLGKAVPDSLTIELNRRFPGTNGDTSYIFKLAPLLYQSNFKLKVPIDVLRGIGENVFTVILDRYSEIEELSELNNQASNTIIIRSGDLIPIYPYNYAVVPNQGITLKASTAFAFETGKNYLLEIDVNADFNSPSRQSASVFSAGGVVEWAPSILMNMPDSAVYFWRVSKTPDSQGRYFWKTFSFQYIPNKRGWGQDHFDQLKLNDFQFMEPNISSQRFNFVDNVRQLSCVNIGNPPTTTILGNIKYSVDSELREKNGCTVSPTFMVAVLDSLSFESWQTPYNGQNLNRDYGQANINGSCRSRSESYFMFRANSPTQLQSMRTMLLDSVPDGNYILVYSWYNIKYTDINVIDPAIMQTFTTLGATKVTGISDSIPFILAVKKGKPSTIKEVVGDSINQQIELKMTLISSSTFGDITSRFVGPAMAWDTVVWVTKSLELNSQDSSALTISSFVNSEANGTKIFSNLPKSISRLDVSAAIDAVTKPYLRLQMSANDEQFQTPPQLDLWHVYYDPVPEAALNPKNYFSVNKDTLMEGETFQLAVDLTNVSEFDMDSVLIKYQIVNSQNKVIGLPQTRIKPLLAGENYQLEVSVPTLGLPGSNTLIIEVNPLNDQPEQFHFNNIGQYSFYVLKDNINPLMDVTFDGRRIINGELIGPEPEIVIQLMDENKYLLLNDTSDFAIYLKTPNQNEKRVYFGVQSDGSQMEFREGTLPQNKARIVYRPKLYEDGTYQLRAQANDKSGNLSGSNDYLISFQIETKASISRLMNYPNPFTTSTRFVFTLSGTRIPDFMQIQIMTITGKLVREIDLAELGNIHIGQNITDYAWDGTDEFGDRLANGVYLYRVRTNLDGQSIEHRASGADKYFKEDFGKMYLMR